MYALFTATIFLGSALLFLIQPMVARMILPVFGGAPNVWNTSLVFFQGALLAGYGYAHLSTRWLGVRRQAILHVVLVALPLLILPFALPLGYNPRHTDLPIPIALLSLLSVMIGLPFLAVSAGAPLVQRWFGATGHAQAKDPYFLYAASNLGSIIGLVSYPFVIEPALGLRDQSRLWMFGYGALVAALVACAVATQFQKPRAESIPEKQIKSIASSGSSSTWKQRGMWIILAAAPSSLLLGVTNFLSTNVAAVPLLWVVPLTIYLLTYVAAFSRRRFLSEYWLGRLLAIAMVPVAIVSVQELNEPMSIVTSIHLLFFAMAALYCHSRLADMRPKVADLTEYYFWISAGGVLGGIFGALLAPVVFHSVIEYPLVMCLVLALRVRENPKPSNRLLDFGYPVFVGIVTALCIWIANAADIRYESPYRLALTICLPVFVAFISGLEPLRSALSFGVFFVVASILHPALEGKLELIERSFFGVHRVTLSANGEIRSLLHGNTIHGRQFTDPARKHEALTYYHTTGPMGQVFEELNGSERLDRVGLVGLGAGSLAAYGRPGQTFDFYEIDPVVVQIAREPRYFTFLSDSKAKIQIILGDARLSLADAPDGTYNLIVLDAFSSDAIPVHLLTREAISMYVRKLRPGGVLAFHISNRYLDLKVPLIRAAIDLRLARRWEGEDVPKDVQQATGKTESEWMILARTDSDLGPLGRDHRWVLPGEIKGHAWTDDYSNIVSIWQERVGS